MIKRGKFKSLENGLEVYHNGFINCLYIMRALERGNNISYDEEAEKPIDLANNKVSPMILLIEAVLLL